MSPLDYIKEGILKGNWETVREGYERMTGESLQLPSTIDTTTTLQQVYDIVAMALEEPGYVPSNPEPTKKKKKSGRPKKVIPKTVDKEDSSLLDVSKVTTTQRNLGTVQLITNEPDPEEVEQNQIRAQKTNKGKRKSPVTYNVECNECEKSFKSNRPGGDIGQKCNKCLIKKKK